MLADAHISSLGYLCSEQSKIQVSLNERNCFAFNVALSLILAGKWQTGFDLVFIYLFIYLFWSKIINL